MIFWVLRKCVEANNANTKIWQKENVSLGCNYFNYLTWGQDIDFLIKVHPMDE